MSVEINPNMPGMDEASRRLDAMIAEESAAATEAQAKTADASENQEQLAAQDEIENAPSLDPKPSDTPAESDKAAAANQSDKSSEPEAKKPDAKAADAKATDKTSRYAKSQERLTKTWESVNAEKVAMTAEKARLESERAEFARQRAEFEAIRQQAEQPQHPPEAYAQAAAQKRQMADHLRAEAERAENAGNFTKAEELRKQATKNEAIAEDLAEHAEKLKSNPPPAFKEKAAKFEQDRRTWTLEAAKAFPDLAKDGSAFQQAVATHIDAMAKLDPKMLAQPSAIYHASKLAAAELKAQQYQTESARVPGLVKELGELKAKVKELEAMTTPGSSTTAQRLGSSQTDEEAELEAMARDMVTLR